ncbi:hypothetical protein AVEN_74320-1 [Araneus ventricosus]|uniref:Uncharacterized protein n=1 Tax=Araneus ventricosus TaxID=182803 RepID=A0A4Y2HN41_ARAVE|nr:hypothetical protein AVEN_74320-1 [Araneus ventricosus]
MCQLWESPHSVLPRLLEFSQDKESHNRKTFAPILKERRQPSTTTAKALNQEIQPTAIPETTDTGLLLSQEPANIPLPADFQVNKEELAF